MVRDVVLSIERFISSSPHYCTAPVFPIPSPTCHRCRESRLRSLRLLTSLHGVGGVLGFWEAPSRLLAGRRLPSTPGVRRSPSIVFFFFLRADNPTVRMSIFSLLFGLISFLLLALDPINLSQIVVLVLIHICVIHVVSLFLVVGINLCIAKLLLFPTWTRAINWHDLGYEHWFGRPWCPIHHIRNWGRNQRNTSWEGTGTRQIYRCFYKKCWSGDHVFFQEPNFKALINMSHIVLLPKVQDATALSNYRPISLINSVIKIITKLLANRLAPHMNDLILKCPECIHIKRCSHDNFIYAQRESNYFTRKRSRLYS